MDQQFLKEGLEGQVDFERTSNGRDDSTLDLTWNIINSTLKYKII